MPTRCSKHPNGVTGIAEIVLLARPGGVAGYAARLSPFLTTAADAGSHTLELSTPNGGKVQVSIRDAISADEQAWIKERGEGLFKVILAREGGSTGSTESGVIEGARIEL